MEAKRISPLKAIRLKCLDCSCGSSNEVKLCTVERCPLYPFREGHNPYTAKREWTEEQRAVQKARMMQNIHSVERKKSKNSLSEGTYIPGRNSEEFPGRMEG